MMNELNPIVSKIIAQVKKRYQKTLISIFGIGSYFDQTLKDDWITNDVDVLVVLKDLKGVPKHEWTEVRFERKNMSGYEVWIGYNTLDGLKDKNLFQAQSFSNYEWSIIELKYPENSVVLFGTNIRDHLPDIHKLEFDFDDLFRRCLYHLDRSYKTELKKKNPKKAKFQFTKAVFKFCFYLCVYHDRTFHYTSLKRIAERINALKKREVIASKILIILEVCVLFRRGKGFIKDFHTLRNDFTQYILTHLGKGTFHRKMEYRQLLVFLKDTFGGLTFLIKIIRNAKQRHEKRRKEKEPEISDEEIKEVSLKVKKALFNEADSVAIMGTEYKIKRFARSGLRYVDIGKYRFVEQNPNKSSVWAQKARQGDKILWVFKKNEYFARVLNEEFTLL